MKNVISVLAFAMVVGAICLIAGCGDTTNVTSVNGADAGPSVVNVTYVTNDYGLDGGGTTVINDTTVNNYYVSTPDGGITVNVNVNVVIASPDGGAAASPDSGPTIAIDTGSPILADAKPAADTAPMNADCSVGNQIFIGRGTGSVLAGSARGFGIVWSSNYRSAKQTDVLFQAVDGHGANLAPAETVNTIDDAISPWLDIVTMSGSYVIDIVPTGTMDNYWFRNFDGSGTSSTVNQPHGYLPIVGSNDQYFIFMNNGSLSPVLNELQLGVGFFTTVATYQWGPAGAKILNATKAAKLNDSSWAFAMVADSIASVAAVDADGVHPTVIIDTAGIGGIVTIGDIIAIDDGYALLWSWFPSDLSSRRAFISFIPVNGSFDGKAHNTVEIGSLAPWIQIIEKIAWNGKNIGYLTMNASPNPTDASQQVGKFFLLDKLGKAIETATVASPFRTQTTGQMVSFDASGSSFGVVISSLSDPTVRFQAIDCD